MPTPAIPSGYTPVSQVIPPRTTTATEQVRVPTKELDKDAFLKLLVAQLKYQDPSKPVDSNELMAQTAQFTQVEKLTDMADMQTQILGAQRMLSASTMVGSTVTYPGEDNLDVTGVVTSARFTTDGPVLHVGDKDVPLTSVKEVRASTPGS